MSGIQVVDPQGVVQFETDDMQIAFAKVAKLAAPTLASGTPRWHEKGWRLRTDFDDPTKRVEATTTPEGAKGWADQAGSAQVLAGGHGLDVAPDASPEGVRAEIRREEDRAGGEPSNAPAADIAGIGGAS